MSQIRYSFEVFPAKTTEAETKFWNSISVFSQMHPDFISVTANSDSQRSGLTKDIALKTKKISSKEVAAHMILGSFTPLELEKLAESYLEAGITHIVALRGDEMQREDSLRYATDLIKILKKCGDFKISVTGYPEKHPEARDLKEDVENLKKKVDLGVDQIITQFFFDPDTYLHFTELTLKHNIKVPIIPGILPITNINRLVAFANKCGASVPEFLIKMFAFTKPDELDHKLLAMNVLSHQITKLIDNGVRRFHFYTLNETILTSQVCRWLEIAF